MLAPPRFGAFPALGLFLVAGCLDSPTEVAPAPEIEDVEFAAALGIDLADFTRTDSGLHWRADVEGDGPVASLGDRVWVHYHGWVPNGVTFDSSETGGPIDFVLGTPNVIVGFQEGILGMRVGGTRMLLIPPHLAYGAAGVPGAGIPSNSWLVMRVELVPDPDDDSETA